MAKRGRPKKVETAVVKAPVTAVAVIEEPQLPTVVDAQALIARAIDKNLPIESMERLLVMRRELRAEWARDQYFAALAQFQRQCPVIGKSNTVRNKPEKGGGVRYKYAPLDVIITEVKDILEENGFSYTLATEQTADSVTAICNSHHRAGHSEATRLTVPIDHEAYMTEPQKVASALTYASRYAFRNAFGIMTGDDDDDAQSVSAPPRIKQTAMTVEDAVVKPNGEELILTEVGDVPKPFWNKRDKMVLFEAFGPAVDYRVAKNSEGVWKVTKVEQKAFDLGVKDSEIPF